jgi:hypothetical protein
VIFTEHGNTERCEGRTLAPGDLLDAPRDAEAVKLPIADGFENQKVESTLQDRDSFAQQPMLLSKNDPGAPYPRFPVELSGFRELHAPFLKERRTSGLVRCCVQEIRGISLVFREMWGATVGRPFTTWTNTSRKRPWKVAFTCCI